MTALALSADERVPLVRVLVIDDSAVARASLARVIKEHPALCLAGVAHNASQAIAMAAEAKPDVILLDLEMPGRTGLAALPELLVQGNGAHVLIVSASAATGAVATLRALALGAADTLEKPTGGILGHAFGAMLVDKVLRLGRAGKASDGCEPFALRAAPDTPVGIVGIGASTGGIGALAAFFAALPKRFAAPIIITQHLPPSFFVSFAGQVSAMAGRPARVATEGAQIQAGDILIAPGEAHLLVRRGERGDFVSLTTVPSATRNCPAIDPMLASLASFGPDALAVVLSGMGRDGSDGVQALVAAGGTVVVQDAASSAVWGMPGVVARAGHASLIAEPARLAAYLAARGAR